MSDIKLVLTDVDDTIALQMQHTVTDNVRQCVIDMENNGVTVAAVTGRAYAHAKELMKVLGIEGPCVFDGGASVYDTVSEEVLWKQWLEADVVREIVEHVLPQSSDLIYAPDYAIVKASKTDPNLINEAAPFVFTMIHDKYDAHLLAKGLQNIPNVSFHVMKGIHADTGATSMAIQVTHKLADKFHGVEALRNIVGIPIEHTLGIGDGINDLPLFENSGIRVAMGNAGDALKEKADFITETVHNDGFVIAINRYVLNK